MALTAVSVTPTQSFRYGHLLPQPPGTSRHPFLELLGDSALRSDWVLSGPFAFQLPELCSPFPCQLMPLGNRTVLSMVLVGLPEGMKVSAVFSLPPLPRSLRACQTLKTVTFVCRQVLDNLF